MEYSPPPLFKQGASARVKMMVFAGISIALLLVDSRMHALTAVRQAVGTVLYPVQMAALVPRDVALGVGTYFSSLSALEKQVRELRHEQIASAQILQQAQLNIVENNHLRKLMEARERVPVKSMLAEILYDTRDSATRKIVLDRGIQNGVELGRPVIDNLGVVGQVTRVFPFTSEVTLLTDEEQAIPVQLLRTGVRSVAYGRGKSGTMELRFTEPTADIQIGDIVITSGLDGLYPAGLAVARVTLVERNAHGPFGRVVCQPLAGIERNTQLLILTSSPDIAPRPPAEEIKVGRKIAGKMAPIKDAPKPAATQDATAAPANATPAKPASKPAAPPATTTTAAPTETTR
ncbi:rod shape-determining protein MreC [Janthinobacterium psychrotolerans]|uniref:Cell shape-determining protein MreC n=1 Tax=Janthinobacterium psychrotolerans TaxID=1747903 RepID=A0A1A7BZP3_9BURK|nr:rod shape-determining protein MreC [Janthinobacterium psychrotolerans]OBV38972.1 rod shape-determining protein MreC [Janthinobacterium psychrotolerans]